MRGELWLPSALRLPNPLTQTKHAKLPCYLFRRFHPGSRRQPLVTAVRAGRSAVRARRAGRLVAACAYMVKAAWGAGMRRCDARTNFKNASASASSDGAALKRVRAE